MAELRIRNLSKDLQAKIKLMEKEFKTPESSKAIAKLIDKYFEDQKMIKLLQDRNTNLHRSIKKYYDKEEMALKNIVGMTHGCEQAARMIADFGKRFRGMQKQFTKKGGKR